jgi:hypothetical protein
MFKRGANEASRWLDPTEEFYDQVDIVAAEKPIKVIGHEVTREPRRRGSLLVQVSYANTHKLEVKVGALAQLVAARWVTQQLHQRCSHVAAAQKGDANY